MMKHQPGCSAVNGKFYKRRTSHQIQKYSSFFPRKKKNTSRTTVSTFQSPLMVSLVSATWGRAIWLRLQPGELQIWPGPTMGSLHRRPRKRAETLRDVSRRCVWPGGSVPWRRGALEWIAMGQVAGGKAMKNLAGRLLNLLLLIYSSIISPMSVAVGVLGAILEINHHMRDLTNTNKNNEWMGIEATVNGDRTYQYCGIM